MSLTNKSIVVVTGAASGIGRALAVRLAREKIKGLAISDVNEIGLRETAQMLENTGVKVSTHIVNVGERSEVERFVEEVQMDHGGASHLINNAGVSLFGDVEEVSIEDIEWLMNINFWGVVYGTKLFLPVLRQQPLAHLINISSVFGIIAPPGNAAYAASKFAVRGFTEALRHELDKSNVLISVVLPGGIRTSIVTSGRLGAMAHEADRQTIVQIFNQYMTPTTADGAAEVIVQGIKNRRPRILIGTDARQISILSRIFPCSYLKVIDFLTGGKLSKVRQSINK